MTTYSFSYRNSEDISSRPAVQIALVTKANADLPYGSCRALLVGTAGTANIVDLMGHEHSNVPLQQGYNPIGAQRIKTGGSADNIWALY